MATIGSVYLERLISKRALPTLMFTYLGIPHSDIQGSVLNSLQENRLRPGPTAHDFKELANDNRTNSHWIKLANSGHKHGPCNTTRKTDDVSVDRTSYN